MEVYGPVYKGSLHSQKPPPKKELKLSRLQGKHLEHEMETKEVNGLVYKRRPAHPETPT